MQRRVRITLAVTAVSGALLAGAGTAAADGLGGLGGLLGGDDDSSNSRYDSGGYYGSNYGDSDSDYGNSDYGDIRVVDDLTKLLKVCMAVLGCIVVTELRSRSVQMEIPLPPLGTARVLVHPRYTLQLAGVETL